MKIRNHKLDGASYRQARHVGGIITPEIVVLHDTAGRLAKGNSAEYLAENDAEVSVHFVVERDGTIAQLVPTNRRASHCGQSSFHGRAGCNDFSIGIEIVNPGCMKLVSQAPMVGRAWFKETFSAPEYDLEWVQTSAHGAGVWMDYTRAQIEAVAVLLEALFRDIKSLRDITTHWYISPGRKVDVNPLFPLDELRAAVLGRDDPAEIEAEAGSVAGNGLEFVRINTPGSTLNMRRWPSFNPNVVMGIPDKVIVPVNRVGAFAGRDWLNVSYAGREGWIVATYTDPILVEDRIFQST